MQADSSIICMKHFNKTKMNLDASTRYYHMVGLYVAYGGNAQCWLRIYHVGIAPHILVCCIRSRKSPNLHILSHASFSLHCLTLSSDVSSARVIANANQTRTRIRLLLSTLYSREGASLHVVMKHGCGGVT